MGIKKNADASYNLGLGVSDANDYKGFAGQNEITIQLTADGATDKSMDALNYLKTFALNQAAAGLPIKPSASVSISANGYTKALEADDFEITETGVKIGGIEYTASTDSWDFTNALVPSGGGGGGSGVFEISFTVEWSDEQQTNIVTCNKTYAEILAAKQAGDYIVAKANFFNEVRTKDCFSAVDPAATGFLFIGVSTNNNYMLVASIVYNDYANGWMLETPKYYGLTPLD